MKRWAVDPNRFAGHRGQFGSQHTLGYYDPTGRVAPVASQNSARGGNMFQGSGPQYDYLKGLAQRLGGFGGFQNQGQSVQPPINRMRTAPVTPTRGGLTPTPTR